MAILISWLLSHYIQKGRRGVGVWHLLPLLPKLAFSKGFILKTSKMIFDQKNEGFISSCFTTDEEIFVVLNPSEKDREKHCFLILGLLKVIIWLESKYFLKKEWVRHHIWLLVAFDAFKLHFCFTTGPKHPKCWNWKTGSKIVVVRTRGHLKFRRLSLYIFHLK